MWSNDPVTPEVRNVASHDLRLGRAANLTLLALGVALAFAGTTEHVDAIVPWVFGIVDGIPFADLWRPVYNPEPMDTYAYRPLAVLTLKVALWVSGRDPVALTLAHGLVLACFALVSARFLRRHGFDRVTATLAAASALVMPSLLFSAWICVEFDLVGATFVLAAASALHQLREADSRGVRVRFWVLATLAMLTKETSALQLLAYIGAFAFVHRREKRWWSLSAAYVGLVLVVTAPMHFVDSGNTHAFTIWGDGFHPVRIGGMLLHTAGQVLFLLSAAGVVLVAATALRSTGLSAHRRVMILSALTVASFLFAPVLRHYSHFEAVIFSSLGWTLVGFLVLGTALSWLIVVEHSADRRIAITMVVLTWAGFAAAPILLKFARADVSARIFAACVPALHALVWREARALWDEATRGGRANALVLAGAFFLFAAASAFNTIAFHRVRLAVEFEAKQRLAKDVRSTCPALINTNPVQLLTTEELRALGAGRLSPEAWVETTTAQPDSTMSVDDFAAAGGITAHPGQDVYLYIQTARSLMSADIAEQLAGDFRWTKELLPESDDDLFAAYQRMIYEIETDIETMFRTSGWVVSNVRLEYVQLPLWWNELPARWLAGVPVVERYDYVARVFRIPARRPGWSPPDGCGRRDHNPDR